MYVIKLDIFLVGKYNTMKKAIVGLYYHKAVKGEIWNAKVY